MSSGGLLRMWGGAVDAGLVTDSEVGSDWSVGSAEGRGLAALSESLSELSDSASGCEAGVSGPSKNVPGGLVAGVERSVLQVEMK